jgi:hypothetical protein
VYTMGYLEPQSVIYGTAITDFFIHKTAATIYENYLTDIEINRNNLSEFFLTSSLLNTGASRNIVQWVK